MMGFEFHGENAQRSLRSATGKDNIPMVPWIEIAIEWLSQRPESSLFWPSFEIFVVELVPSHF